MANELLGIALEIGARRQSFAERHPALARFFLGRGPVYRDVKATRITVDCTRPEERTIEAAEPPKPAPPAPKPRKPVVIPPIGVVNFKDERGRSRVGIRPSYASAVTEIVCAVWGVRFSRVMSAERTRRVAYPRNAAFLILRERTGASLTPIGKFFKRDHTTVMHGLQVARRLAAEDPEWKANYDHACALIEEAAKGTGEGPASGEP